MNLEDYVKENQKIISMVKERVPGRPEVDMYYGTLDYATARFNTILLKLSQDRLLEDRLKADVEDCFKTIQDFYDNVQRYSKRHQRSGDLDHLTAALRAVGTVTPPGGRHSRSVSELVCTEHWRMTA